MTRHYDIIVCGGGMAGIGAAVAAARQGVKVLLVERLEVLGGLGASGGVGNFCAAQGGLEGQGRVFDDILDGLKRHGAAGEEHGWRVKLHEALRCENRLFDHQILPLVLMDLAEESGVELLFATDMIGAHTQDGAITEIVLQNRSLHQTVSAPVYVDGTGEGLLARHAGARELADDPNLPGVIKPSFMIFLRKVEDAKCQAVPGKRYYGPGDAIDYSLWGEPGGRIGLKLKLFDQVFDTGTGAGYHQALVAMRRRIPEVVRHFQENHDPSYVFDFASPMLGLREGRRVEGEHVLAIADLRAGRRFADSVAYGTFTVDANRTREVLPPYQIPYRSLLAKDVENCLVAGRCFSADRLALSSARTMATGCLMGQAAGMAAALAVQQGQPLRAADTAQIRALLLADARDQELMAKRLSPDLDA